MLEAWASAPLRARLFNGMYLLLLAMAFCACCVAFGAELFHAQSVVDAASSPTLPPRTFRFYHDHIAVQTAASLPFTAMIGLQGDNDCGDGGRVLVAFSALCFVLLLPALALSALRALSLPLSCVAHPRQSLLVELLLCACALPLYLTGMASYGALCYSAFQDSAAWRDVRATGFAYTIVGFFWLALAGGMGLAIRKDEDCWLGVGGDGAFGSTRTQRGHDPQRDAVDRGAGAEAEPIEVEDSVTTTRHSRAEGKAKGKARAKNYVSNVIDYTTYSYQHVDE